MNLGKFPFEAFSVKWGCNQTWQPYGVFLTHSSCHSPKGWMWSKHSVSAIFVLSLPKRGNLRLQRWSDPPETTLLVEQYSSDILPGSLTPQFFTTLNPTIFLFPLVHEHFASPAVTVCLWAPVPSMGPAMLKEPDVHLIHWSIDELTYEWFWF